LPTTTPSGANRFTGHACRCAGAIYLASAGVDLWRIQLFGRWGSEAFKLYTRKAPLLAIGNIALDSVSSLGVQDMLKELVAKATREGATSETLINENALRNKGIPGNGSQGRLELPIPLADVAKAAGLEEPPPAGYDNKLKSWFVVNETVKKNTTKIMVHICDEIGCSDEASPVVWKAKCGWRVGLSINSRKATSFDMEEGPDHKNCPGCFGTKRRWGFAKLASQASSSRLKAFDAASSDVSSSSDGSKSD
jgi:hypothetical protein